MIAFPYFGGKSQIAKELIALFPEHGHYVEPFGGSASVLINKAPSKIETYNDLDSDVVCFFRCLRNSPEQLLRLIQLTPWSREEFYLARVPSESDSDLEKARKFYVRIRQGFNAIPRLRSNGWKYSICAEARSTSPAHTWQDAVESLEFIAKRFSKVQIENAAAMDVIQRLDRPETFFYIDPPYVLSARSLKSSHNQNLAYVHEMEDSDHEYLAEVLGNLKGKILLSGYNSDLYQTLFKGWNCINFKSRAISSSKAKRTETVWLNYDPPQTNFLGALI